MLELYCEMPGNMKCYAPSTIRSVCHDLVIIQFFFSTIYQLCFNRVRRRNVIYTHKLVCQTAEVQRAPRILINQVTLMQNLCIFTLHITVDWKIVRVELIRFSTARKIIICKDWLLAHTHYGFYKCGTVSTYSFNLFCVAYDRSKTWTAWPLEMGQIGSPETSVTNLRIYAA
jgi:hypothetical protein